MKLETLLESADMKLVFSSHICKDAEPLQEFRTDWTGTGLDTLLTSSEDGAWRISVDSMELSSPC